MKETKTMTALTVKELAVGLRTQSILKRDFVVPSEMLKMEGGILKLNLSFDDKLEDMLHKVNISICDHNNHSFYNVEPNKVCHEQLAEKLFKNKKYYDRVLNEENKILLDMNTNYWLHKENKNFLLRTFMNPDGSAGVARAFLSDTYKPIDNWDIAMTVLNVIKEYPGLKLDAANITEERFYMRFTDPNIMYKAPDLVRKYGKEGRDNPGIIGGFIISNSEVGKGGFNIAPRAVILACNNGMTRIEDRMRKIHLGGKLEQGMIIWSENTTKKNLELIQAQAEDAIKAWLTTDYLKDLTGWLLDLKKETMTHPIDCTKNICSDLGLYDESVENILKHFIDNGDSSVLGVVNAITEGAQMEAPDKQYEIEERILSYPKQIDKFDYVKK